MSIKTTNREKWIDRIFFAALLAVVSAVTLLLFYRQTVGNPQYYHSDMKAYILEMQGIDSGYSFPYPILFKLGAMVHLFAGPELSMAIATMLLNSLGMLCIKLYLNRYVLEKWQAALPGREWQAGLLLSLVSASLFFISMLFPPPGMYLPGIKYRYLGVFTANPFHNATYMAARPFAILAFFQYVKLLNSYEKVNFAKQGGSRKPGNAQVLSGQYLNGQYLNGQSLTGKDYVLFSLFLLLATMAKPSFTIVLVGAAGLIMLYRLFRSGFRNFRQTLFLGLCFVPTFADLLYQFQGVFVPTEGTEGGIGFCFGKIWRLYCDNIPLAVCLAVGFPLLVLLLHPKEWKGNTLYRFSWQLYAMSFAMAFFLYEKGFREPDFNFSWGYMYGIFFCFVGALIVLLEDTAACRKEKGNIPLKKKILLGIQWLAYAGHLLCGLYYFQDIFRGHLYY